MASFRLRMERPRHFPRLAFAAREVKADIRCEQIAIDRKEGSLMFKTLAFTVAVALSTSIGFAAEDVVHALEETVKKLDSATKTVVIETKDGTEHAFHYTGDVVVDG